MLLMEIPRKVQLAEYLHRMKDTESICSNVMVNSVTLK